MGVDNQFNEEASLEAKLSCLEEMATGELLVELLNAKKAEVFENVVFQGQNR